MNWKPLWRTFRLSRCRRPIGGRSLRCELLEARRVLAASGFEGNDCPPDLDLSSVAAQSVEVGQPLTLDLMDLGGTVEDLDDGGTPTGDSIRFHLDPDSPEETPAGATISSHGIFTWTPEESQLGTHTIVVIAVDEGTPHLADVETFSVTVNQRVAPSLDLNGEASGTGAAASFTEQQDPVALTPQLVIAAGSSDELVSARVELTNLLDDGQETLSVETTGTDISASFDAGTGVLSLTGTDSVANYQQVLRTLSYGNGSTDPDATDREINILVDDGVQQSNSANVTVSIAINTAPVLDPISDGQAALGEEFEVTITASDADSDTLTFELVEQAGTPSSAELVQNSNTEAVLRWTPSESDGDGPFTFTVVVTDDRTPMKEDSQPFTVTVPLEAVESLTVGQSLAPHVAGVTPDPAVGETAPVFTTLTDEGVPATVNHDGTAKIYAFFAHWCSVCQAELPELVEHLETEPLPAGVELIGISTAVDPTMGNFPPSAWFDDEQWPLDVLVDSTQDDLATAFGLSAFPFWVVADGAGVVLQRVAGGITTEQFDGLVDLAADSL